MNLNLITYTLYFSLMAIIILKVGWSFFKHGALYLYDLMGKQTADALNRLLLVGYYLINLGFVAATLGFWPEIENWIEAMEMLAKNMGMLMISLGGMHFFNMAWVQLLKTKNTLNTTK